jgi:uncharacterized protein
LLNKLIIPLVLLLTACSVFSQRSKTPSAEDKVRTYATDKTGTLSTSQMKLLDDKLSAFEKETSNQVVVWMVPSLDGGSLEDKSYEIAEQNGIGQKGKDNGVLLFIAKNDRKLRIEVGYGLEGALPDALCDQIIRKEITPEFKKGKFYEGINAGVDAIIKATKGEYTADNKTDDSDVDNMTVCCIPLPVFIFVLIFGGFFVLPIIFRLLGWSKKGGSGNWWTGGSGSSSSSWSSGGGFSGGGGSFGGGGSSGSW